MNAKTPGKTGVRGRDARATGWLEVTVIRVMVWMAAVLGVVGMVAVARGGAGGVTVAAYYFPDYHPSDARNAKVHGAGWSEWGLVKAARPRFEGERQPRVPVWGYGDESDPGVMARKIDAAAEHGVDALIYDWYFYEDGPFLQRGLEEGFMKAGNCSRVKFALMWANHDWLDIHPYDPRKGPAKLLYPGKVSAAGFGRMTDYVIGKYFGHPSYWKIGGRPYFSVYDVQKLVESFGSLAATRGALDGFRAKARAAGFAGLHLNAVMWGRAVLPGEKAPVEPGRIVRELGFDSVTSYVWVHHVPLLKFPVNDYANVRGRYLKYWDEAEREFAGVPYYPNVSVGWDSSPRAKQDVPFDAKYGYPFTPVIGGNTPGEFRKSLEIARERLMKRPEGERVLTINSWNEWTEGSYLEPDTENGMGYLDAIKAVFGGG